MMIRTPSTASSLSTLVLYIIFQNIFKLFKILVILGNDKTVTTIVGLHHIIAVFY